MSKYPKFSISIAQETYNAQAILSREVLKYPALQFCKAWLLGQKYFQLFTSGSTGVPKEIVIERMQMEQSALATIQALSLVPGTKALVAINTDYIGGKMMLVRGMLGGWDLTLISPSSNPLASLDLSQHFDFTALVPLQLHSIMANSSLYAPFLNRMKAIIVGGGAVTTALQEQLQNLKVAVYNTYGMTETVSHIALKCLNGQATSAYYQVLPGVKIQQDHRDCLTIQSAVTKGEVLTTNDVVRLVSDQEFEWLGRADHMINTGGIKIPLEQLEKKIEMQLYKLQIRTSFAVVPLEDARFGQKIVLAIESQGMPISLEVDELRSGLTKYEVPKEIIRIEAFPLTASGKTDRKALKEMTKKLTVD